MEGPNYSAGTSAQAQGNMQGQNISARTSAAKEKSIKKEDLSEDVKSQFVKKLITNFDELVVNFLDKSARQAIINQQTFTDEKEFRRIKLAIEDRVLQLLVNESEITTQPVVSFFRQIVGVLSNRYPYMFLEDPSLVVQGVKVRLFQGKGTGGLSGVRSLPKALQQKFARLLEAKNGVKTEKKPKRDLQDGTTEQQAANKKKKKVHGIKTDIYYVKGTEQQDTFLEEVSSVESSEDREVLFSQHRKDLQHRLVSSQDIFSAVPGFFSELVHGENHFQWLTGKNLEASIEHGMQRQFKIIQAVVQKMCSSKEFKLRYEIAKIKGLELNGSIVPEFLCLLRQLNVEWHKTPGALFRFPSEPEPEGPHILCCNGPESLKFDIHAEMNKIYSDLNFSEALRAFFAVAFIANMQYPEDGESVALLLQRNFAVVNAEGTSTSFSLQKCSGSALF
jgi:hypothetical protein